MTLAEQFLLALLNAPAPVFALDASQWSAVTNLARNHGLAPLLYDKCKRTAPPELLVLLREDYFLTLTRNQLLFEEFRDLARELDRQKVPFVALKGLALAHIIYESPVSRPLYDLDLLIRPEDLPAARMILLGRGFSPASELTPGFRDEYQIDLSFGTANPFPHNVELHWHLFRPHYTKVKTRMDWFWSHGQDIQVGNHLAKTFDPTAQLLHLAGHASLGHRGTRWLWLYDIARLVERRGDEIDWGETLRTGEEFGLTRALVATFEATRTLFGTKIRDDSAHRLAHTHISTLEEINFAFANAPDDQARVIGDGLIELMMERRVGIWRAHLFPSDEFLRARYGAVNAWTRWRYALQRVSYIFTRAPRFVWRMLRGAKKERLN